MFEALHFQYFLGGLVSLITITNPPSKMPLFISLTQGMSEERRRQQANWAGIYAAAIMLVSLVCGNVLLAFFGISYGAMRIAGGLVVAAIGYQMLLGVILRTKRLLFAATARIMLFPHCHAGYRRSRHDRCGHRLFYRNCRAPGLYRYGYCFAWTALAILCATSLSWFIMRYSDVISNRLGPSGTLVIGKLMGFLLICIGVQFVGSGIRTFIAGG